MQELSANEVDQVSGGNIFADALSAINKAWKYTPVGWAVNKAADYFEKQSEIDALWKKRVETALKNNPKAWVSPDGKILHEPR